jgi:Ca2+:H+ antiporter
VVFLLIPIGLAAGLSSADVRAVFTLNFFAVLTLAPVIAVMTRELSETTGPTVGGLLKATLCNGAEMAVCGFNSQSFWAPAFLHC